MPRVLVLYATTHGHTAKVADALAQTLRARDMVVDLVEARRTTCTPAGYDAVVVAASVHGGEYQAEIRQWVLAHAAELNTKATAFVYVCLGVRQRDPKVQHDLEAIVSRFVQATGWRPATVKPVAGALLYTQYNWFLRRMMKRIVAKAGGDTDTSRDYEYTDWADLRKFGEAFATSVAETTRPLRSLATA